MFGGWTQNKIEPSSFEFLHENFWLEYIYYLYLLSKNELKKKK